jgi:hypothetical protein
MLPVKAFRAVEARAQDELHRRGQRELHPGRQHPVRAEQIAGHGQHQRQRQQQADTHGGEAGPGRGAVRRVGLGLGAGLVAGVAHGAAQPGLHRAIERRGGRVIADMRGLGGQVDRGVPHARHLPERALDAAHARGAGHAADRQVEGVDGGQCGDFSHDGASLDLSTGARSSRCGTY